MNKFVIDKTTCGYEFHIIQEESNRLVSYLGSTKYIKDAKRIKNIVENEFDINNFDKIEDIKKIEKIIEIVESEPDIIMQTIKQLFPTFDEIKKNRNLYSDLVLTVKEGKKNFKKYILDGTLNINNFANKEQIVLICKY
jgi:hypothetical protein